MDEINIEDFMKLDLRIAKIINAEPAHFIINIPWGKSRKIKFK